MCHLRASRPAMLTNIAKSELSESSGSKAAIGLENRVDAIPYRGGSFSSRLRKQVRRIALYANDERDARARN